MSELLLAGLECMVHSSRSSEEFAEEFYAHVGEVEDLAGEVFGPCWAGVAADAYRRIYDDWCERAKSLAVSLQSRAEKVEFIAVSLAKGQETAAEAITRSAHEIPDLLQW